MVDKTRCTRLNECLERRRRRRIIRRREDPIWGKTLVSVIAISPENDIDNITMDETLSIILMVVVDFFSDGVHFVISSAIRWQLRGNMTD